MARHRPALTVEQPNGFRLGDQVADRHNEAVTIDQRRISAPLGSQRVGGERIVWNMRPDR